MANLARKPPPENVGKNMPLRLAIAAEIAFPDGTMTVSGLRKERDAGRLSVERIAGKEYTTLADIEEMRRLCRDQAKGRDFGRSQPATPQPDNYAPPLSGSSVTAPSKLALESALSIADSLRKKHLKRSDDTSLNATSRDVSATVTPLPVPSRT